MNAHLVRESEDSSVKITLSDGVEREIKFTLNAMAELEERYGSVEDAFKVLEEKNSMKALRCILWAGLMHDKANPLTETQVGDLIDLKYMKELMDSLGQAFEKDLPNEEDGSKEGSTDPNE